MPARARRLEVFTGTGRRRTWPADEKAAIVAESYAPGRTVCGVARRHGPVMGIEVEMDGIVVRIGSAASPQAIAAVIRALKVGP